MKTRKIIFVFSIIALFASCTLFHKAVSDKADPKINYEQQGYIKAMVVQVSLDGCMYMLQPESGGQRLEPDGLQPDFQHDSLKVWLKYVPEDRMSVCMAGKTIKVIDIRIR